MGHRVLSLPICKMLSLCVFKSMGCFKLYQSFEYIDLVYPPLTAVALSCPSLLYWDLYHLYILTSVYTHVTHSCQTKVMSAQEQSRYSKWTFAFSPEHLLLLFFLPPPTHYACMGPQSVLSLASFPAAWSMHFLRVTFHCPPPFR